LHLNKNEKKYEMKNNCVKSFISSRSENGKAFKIPLNKNGKKLKKKTTTTKDEKDSSFQITFQHLLTTQTKTHFQIYNIHSNIRKMGKLSF